MLSLRLLVVVGNGKLSPAWWLAAVGEEPRTRAKPVACPDCPLRPGGEWEANTKLALADMTPAQLEKMKRWTCHAATRPCAGMLRLVKETEVTKP